jgi:hypothetical protein
LHLAVQGYRRHSNASNRGANALKPQRSLEITENDSNHYHSSCSASGYSSAVDVFLNKEIPITALMLNATSHYAASTLNKHIEFLLHMAHLRHKINLENSCRNGSEYITRKR